MNAPSNRPIRPVQLVRRGKLKLSMQRRGAALFGRRVETKILTYLGGPVFFQIARTAYRMDLIGLVRRQPGITREEIQRQLNLPEGSTHVILLGCVAMKFLKKRGERYYYHRLGLGKLLDPSEPFNLAPHLELMHHITEPTIRYLEESLRTETPAGIQAFPGDEDSIYGRLAHLPELQKIFYDALNVRTQSANPHFLDRVDFSPFSRVMDVAGGDGEILQTIAESYPKLHGTVLEIPTVAQLANERFAKRNLSDRLRGVPIDIFHEEFPPDHDCILFCHVLGNHSPAANVGLLKRAFAALPVGGIVMIYSAFMDDDGTGPLSAAMISAFFLCAMSGKGRQYSRKECEAWLTEAGFVESTRVGLIMNHGALIARKP